MSELTVEAVNCIEKSSLALLTTVGEDNKPYMRYIGPFVNDGLDISFFTMLDTQKVKHIDNNPFVSIYVHTLSQPDDDSKSVVITGKAVRVSEGDEFNRIFEKLNLKSPGYMKYLSGAGVKPWAIYHVTAKTVQFTDLSKSNRTVMEEL